MQLSDTSNNIVEEIDIEKLLNTIVTQTDYSKELAIEKLKEFNYDCMSVIRDYLGTNIKKDTHKSLNQQIYKEIRHHLY
tara:strand:+ start:610 stop:846 length:237 start_codon:yes stop_codon:yes gene_type:complete